MNWSLKRRYHSSTTDERIPPEAGECSIGVIEAGIKNATKKKI
jgi:hypothetical protein